MCSKRTHVARATSNELYVALWDLLFSRHKNKLQFLNGETKTYMRLNSFTSFVLTAYLLLKSVSKVNVYFEGFKVSVEWRSDSKAITDIVTN